MSRHVSGHMSGHMSGYVSGHVCGHVSGCVSGHVSGHAQHNSDAAVCPQLRHFFITKNFVRIIRLKFGEKLEISKNISEAHILT